MNDYETLRACFNLKAAEMVNYLQEKTVDAAYTIGKVYQGLESPPQYAKKVVEFCGPKVANVAIDTFKVVQGAWSSFDRATTCLETTKMHFLGAIGLWCTLAAIFARISGHKAMTGVVAGFVFTTTHTVWHGLSEGTVMGALAKPISMVAIATISALVTWAVTPPKEQVSLPRAFLLVGSPLLMVGALYAGAGLARIPLEV